VYILVTEGLKLMIKYLFLYAYVPVMKMPLLFPI